MILVSIADAAYFTHVPAGTIRRWVAQGKIKKHGRKPWQVDMLEIERTNNAEKRRVSA